jgi:transcriptional regulator with AAA-type ATPase domain
MVTKSEGSHTAPEQARGAETTDLARPDAALDSAQAGRVRFVVVASPDPNSAGAAVFCARAEPPAASARVGETLLFGRDVAGPGLSIADPSMSRLHARCVWDERMQGLRIGDTGSRNGIFLNGRRIESALLGHGDLVRIGETLLVYCEENPFERAEARAAAAAASPLTVLLQGETGTGKEVFARRIHEASQRRGKFVPVNCAAIPRELVAAELFGHTERAFSGAQGARKGLALAAAHGTLLLDEIGDCPPEVQIALLRMLQEKAVRPVGSDQELAVDVRVIAATHRDLQDLVARGSFRADLFARLSQFTIALPPLRERKHQLLDLARSFAQADGATLRITVDAAEALLIWSWPFNLRELQSLIFALLVVRGKSAVLDLAYLSENHPPIAQAVASRAAAGSEPQSKAPLPTLQRPQHDRKRLAELLDQHGGNVSKVAQALGKPRAQVYRWMEALGLSPTSFRKP